MMSDYVRAMLSSETSEVHRRLLSYLKPPMDSARDYWTQRHPAWQQAELLYRTYRLEDESDRETREASMTEGVRKLIVPEAYAQVMSVLAWLMSVFGERQPLIPVAGEGPEDHVAAILHEYLLEYQAGAMRPAFPLVEYQWFLDALIYGIGIVGNQWSLREFPDLVRVGDTIEERDVVAYEGNQAVNISPFNFFPDPRRSVADFQNGEYVYHIFQRSPTELLQKQAVGLYAGVRHLLDKHAEKANKASARPLQTDSELGRTLGLDETVTRTVDGAGNLQLAEMYRYCNPGRLGLLAPGERVPDATPRLWVFTVAEDLRVLRAEPANLPGRCFPYSVIEWNYCWHAPGNPGLIEVIQDLTYHESWLFNSRMANVRKSLNNETIVDPSMLEEADLAKSNASGLIRLTRDAQGSGIDLRTVAYPFPVVDVTSTHHADSRVVREMIEQITGANRLVQGLSNTGRRAATEVQHQMSLASGRLRLGALICTHQGLTSQASQMVRNTQTFLEDALAVRLPERYRRVLGRDAVVILPQLLQGRFKFPFLEAGMPNDRLFEANFWREVWTEGVQSGLAGPAMQQINFLEVFARMLLTSGVKNVGDFYLPGRFPAHGSAAVAVPNEAVGQGVERGTIVPADGFPLPSGLGTPGVGPNGQAGVTSAPTFA